MMRSRPRQFVPLLMLLSLLMNLGAYAFNYSKWLAHEVSQESLSLGSASDHHRPPQLYSNDGQQTEPLSDAQHQLLHTVDHGQPPLLSAIPHTFVESPAGAAPLPAYLLSLSPARGEPPFRPPRTFLL